MIIIIGHVQSSSKIELESIGSVHRTRDDGDPVGCGRCPSLNAVVGGVQYIHILVLIKGDRGWIIQLIGL